MRITAIAALIFATGCATSPSDGTGQPVRRPNIVFIMADDLGWGEVGCYGQEKIRTPNIDRIAASGVRFTQFSSGSPVCAPSRCVLLTGMHTGHSVVRDNSEVGGWKEGDPEGQMPLPEDTWTFSRALQQAGYATCAIGKWGLGGPGSEGAPSNHGFDHFFGYLCQRIAHNQYPTHLWRNGERVDLPGNTWKNLTGEHYAHDLMAEEALAFVDEHADEPFFLYLPFHIPHAALQVPEDSLSEYVGLWDDPPYDGKKGYLPHPTPRAAYAAMVTRMDRDIGRILDRLEKLGLAENTLVCFTSDNGPTFNGGTDSTFFESAGPFRGLKGSVFEGGLRVPLVATWPGQIPPGHVSEHVAGMWDVGTTLLEICGVGVPGNLDGLSFVPALTGRGKQTPHDHLYWEFPAYGGQQALRRGDWKLVRRGLKRGEPKTMLFNLAVDPGEHDDVSWAHPKRVDELKALAGESRTRSAEFPFPALDS